MITNLPPTFKKLNMPAAMALSLLLHLLIFWQTYSASTKNLREFGVTHARASELKNADSLKTKRSINPIFAAREFLKKSRDVVPKKENLKNVKSIKTAAEQQSRFTASEIQSINRALQNRIEYPAIAIQMLWQGAVNALVDVDPQGKVVAVKVKHSSGYRVLDETALEAIQDWDFAGGSKTETIELSFYFKIQN